MKRKNTLWSLVLALVMVLGVFAPLSALAAGTTTKNITVNVHKILMSKEQKKAHEEKTNEEKKYDPTVGINDLGKHFGDSAKEIDKVYFVAIKEGQEGYSDFDKKTKEEKDAIIAKIPDTAKGLTTTTGLPLTLESPGKYNIYEVKHLSTYIGEDKALLAEQLAVPVELELPKHATTSTGVANAIHVYPKNTEDTPTIDKYVINKNGKDVKEASFDKDEDHTWAIEAKIPTGFKDYEFFKLTDKLDTALTYKANQTIKVFVKEDTSIKLEENTDYTVEAPKGTEGGDLIVSLTKAGITKLAAAEGKILRAEFVTTINDKAVMGKDIPNGVELDYGHNPDSKGNKKVEPPDEPKVYTGGKKFIKIDSSQKDKPLEGAEFVVQRGEKEYLVEKDGEYSWKEIANATPDKLLNDGDLKKLTSGADGTFEIKGLKYDRPDGTNYKIVEVKAPEGYALPSKNDFDFTVNDTSYYKDPKAIDLVAADPLKVDNKPLTIPQTGGMGTMIFMVAGLALMGGAFIAMRKRSAEQA